VSERVRSQKTLKSSVKCLQRKSNRNQLCWLVQKVPLSEMVEKAGCKTAQEFLDTRQYSKKGIRSYEVIFGKNFCCPGGRESTEVSIAFLF